MVAEKGVVVMNTAEYESLKNRLQRAEELMIRQSRIEEILKNIGTVFAIQFDYGDDDVDYVVLNEDEVIEKIKEPIKELLEKVLSEVKSELEKL